MLTEEGDTTMHNDENQEVFECAVHDLSLIHISEPTRH